MNIEIRPDSENVKWVHPEQNPGEVFLGNFTENEFDTILRHWDSRRFGKIVYDNETHKPLTGKTLPVFCKEQEVTEKLEKTMDGGDPDGQAESYRKILERNK